MHCPSVSISTLSRPGGSGDMVPLKILKNICSEIHFRALVGETKGDKIEKEKHKKHFLSARVDK